MSVTLTLPQELLSFVTYNTEGFIHLYEPDVHSYIANFDFILLVETFSNTFPSLLFPLHDMLTDANTTRLLGGVALLVKKELSPSVCQIHTEYDNVIILKLSSDRLGTESNGVLLGSYVPPANCELQTNRNHQWHIAL